MKISNIINQISIYDISDGDENLYLLISAFFLNLCENYLIMSKTEMKNKNELLIFIRVIVVR